MRRVLVILLSISLALSLCACGGGEAQTQYDLDLTQLSGTMVYAEVFSMLYDPDPYVGQRVKLDGSLAVWEDERSGNTYYTCIVEDATACCAQGIEFTWAGDHAPEDYPAEGSRITVAGTFGTYDEDGFRYCRLEDAALSW